MASAVASSSIVAARPSSSLAPSDSSLARSFSGLKPATLFSAKSTTLTSKTVSNGSRINCMLVLNPYTNIKHETLSYLPPLTSEQIAKQIDYIVSKNWIPCVEFDRIGVVYREHFHGSGYYDGRYWTMWKLPMFGCQDSSAVLAEIEEAKKAYPDAYIRILGFDRNRQVQVISFLVYRPPGAA